MGVVRAFLGGGIEGVLSGLCREGCEGVVPGGAEGLLGDQRGGL